ncbi:hypothetical protein NC996_17590 [Trichocoleus sp. ST-U2]|uniref:hypothetical protein n=1 Tax=Coleofasciculus sp. FACHB-SPT9 TaxID=2692791 RepID=UPI001689F9F4|nr:hypothetical protein [Coleofasciculus sp. FACHB-SPT9]MBD1887938.1 hypothetical protein [Coleofasciculus sp. FACHB-SPT9]
MKIAGTIEFSGVEAFLKTDSGNYKIHSSEKARLELDRDLHEGVHAKGEEDSSIVPPQKFDGWVKNDSLMLEA